MPQSIEEKALAFILRNRADWAFSPADLAHLGSRAAIDLALHRLHRKGRIRRVLRGVYMVPRTSELLGVERAPDVDAVANALARKFGWRIQSSGAVAQNVVGLSTQIPATYVYLSDGPKRTYRVGATALEFHHAAAKQINVRLRESALLVQALRALGPERITKSVVQRLRRWLDPKLRARVLADTKFVTGWTQAAIRRICRDDGHG